MEMFIISTVISILFGCATAFCILAYNISKSNDSGNSKGSFQDFSTGYSIDLIDTSDKIPFSSIHSYIDGEIQK